MTLLCIKRKTSCLGKDGKIGIIYRIKAVLSNAASDSQVLCGIELSLPSSESAAISRKKRVD
jgi:hypothetical protein